MLTKNHAILRAEVTAHIEADAVIAGDYWITDGGSVVGGRGCFIGCLAHSDDATVLQDRFGMPLMLVRVIEGIFERLSPNDKQAGIDFFDAIPNAVGRDGKDLSLVVWAFLASELRALPTVSDDVHAVIDPVIAGMDLLASGGRWHAAYAAYADYDAAYAYADSDYAAAYAATYAARAAYAAYDADSAYAARATYATYAARAAAYAAAYDAAYDAASTAVTLRQRDTILKLMADAPVMEAAV